mmetsp:Transcript_11209/g.34319  ORF Transcript_11209/g.34319 Transcript_11209/m.34319 type:complete len:96 (-) Transcript_11209:1816-2103(-)
MVGAHSVNVGITRDVCHLEERVVVGTAPTSGELVVTDVEGRPTKEHYRTSLREVYAMAITPPPKSMLAVVGSSADEDGPLVEIFVDRRHPTHSLR